MHSEFPVERLARLAASPFQIGFARQALRLLEPSDLLACEATQQGLLLRSPDEEALARPVALLNAIYGEQLVLSPPRVHYLVRNHQPHEPIMILRVRCARRYRDAVRNDLDAREAVLLEEHSHPRVAVLRTEAPLRTLFGYAETLAQLSENTARHWIWLDRYVPVESPPPGGSAA